MEQGQNRPRLSACVITFNEAGRIRDCLESVRWCDEMVVVDSHSTDETRTIAAQMGAKVIERDWPGFGPQKEFAARAAAHDWVLCLDADERVSPPLRAEIMALRDAGFPGRLGWKIPRLSWYLGRWIRHGAWYPDRCLRLYDRRYGQWRSFEDVGAPPAPAGYRSKAEPLAPVGARTLKMFVHVELPQPPGRLRHDLIHFPYRDISDHLRKIDRYTTQIAAQLHKTGRRAGLADLIGRPLVGFIRSYWLQRGFLDGWQGLLVAYLHAHYTRMKYAKLYALRQKATDGTACAGGSLGGTGDEPL